MWWRVVFLAAVVVSLSACVQSVKVQTPFNPAEHEFAAKPGSAAVTGQAFMRRNDGIVVYAAGSRVMLLPASSYVREIYDASQRIYGAAKVDNLDPRLVQYTKLTQANGEGRFSFAGVPDGQYLIATNVVWMAGDWQQGGDLTRFVTVANGQDVDAILTR